MNSVGDAYLPLSEADFQRVRTLLSSWGGISLNPSKMQMVGNRLQKRLRALGLENYNSYLDLVERSDEEHECFVNALTTNLTAFFREEHHFDALAEILREQPKNRTIHIWSAAASTGEEPYSIAMTAIEALGEKDAQRVRILASDLDTNVLAHAGAGVYAMDRLTKMPPDRIRRFFLRGTGKNEGLVKVKPELQALIDFQQINLLAPIWPVPSRIDVLFCRNVMIYFNKEIQAQILRRFAPLLAPDGRFIAGHSESYSHTSKLFKPCGKTIYKLVEDWDKS